MDFRDDGGPAFPGQMRTLVPEVGDVETGDTLTFREELVMGPGMSLRDWFAGQAMAAIIVGNSGDMSAMTRGAAKDAYAVADVLLEARK